MPIRRIFLRAAAVVRAWSSLVLGGITTNFGVESTARQGWEHGYAILLVEDATNSLSMEMHDFSVRNILPRISRIAKSRGYRFSAAKAGFIMPRCLNGPSGCCQAAWLPVMIAHHDEMLRKRIMKTNKTPFQLGAACKLAALLLISAACFAGCGVMPGGKSMPVQPAMQEARSTPIILREGDVLKITFPGSPNLDTTQPIRRDGKLNLPLIGEVVAAGISPSALQDKLVQAYASQISTKEVVVQVQSSSFPVFVTGAVLHPGKILSDHPLTALEAIMEAGGFNYDTADMRHVKIDRNVNGVMQHYTVDLKALLVGVETKSFYLQPEDIVYVPERFSPF